MCYIKKYLTKFALFWILVLAARQFLASLRKFSAFFEKKQAGFSYKITPIKTNQISDKSLLLVEFIVEDNGFEPLTLCVQGRCSSQLS